MYIQKSYELKTLKLPGNAVWYEISSVSMIVVFNKKYFRYFMFYCVIDPTGSGGLRGGSSGGGYGTERADVCLEVATVTEETALESAAGGGQPRSVMVCGGDRRVIHALVTRGHRVRVQLHNPRMVNSIGMFLLQYSGQSVCSGPL